MTTLTGQAPRILDLAPMMVGNKAANLTEKLEIPEGLTLLDTDQQPTEHDSMFRILNPKSGDDRLTWDRRNFSAMQEARRTFIDLVKKGFKPFRVGMDGKRTNEVMQEFDPNAQQVIFVPMAAVAGG